MPARSAMPRMTTLALAPTAVALPPRSAPRASAHHSTFGCGAAGRRRDEFGDDRGHRRDVGDVVDDRRRAARRPRASASMRRAALAAGASAAAWASCVDDTGLDQGADHDEQARRRTAASPIRRSLRTSSAVEPGDGRAAPGAEQRHDGRLEVQRRVQRRTRRRPAPARRRALSSSAGRGWPRVRRSAITSATRSGSTANARRNSHRHSAMNTAMQDARRSAPGGRRKSLNVRPAGWR